MGKKAVFLDKDGTIVRNIPYGTEGIFEFMPQAVGALKRLNAAGFLLYVVTNQSGVARGYITEHEVRKSLEYLENRLVSEGVRLSGLAYCPHFPEGIVGEYAVSCTCRKPQPGMIVSFVQRDGIDVRQSWMVGDILTDTEAGNRVGARTILTDTGGETAWHLTPYNEPDYTVRTIGLAADIIIRSDPATAGERNSYGFGGMP